MENTLFRKQDESSYMTSLNDTGIRKSTIQWTWPCPLDFNMLLFLVPSIWMLLYISQQIKPIK